MYDRVIVVGCKNCTIVSNNLHKIRTIHIKHYNIIMQMKNNNNETLCNFLRVYRTYLKH